MNAKPRGRQFFNNPGPTNIPDRILRAMDRPVIDFMSDEFIAIQHACHNGVKRVLKTDQNLFFYSATGHGAWEAALANLFSPGETVLMVETGYFSDSWTEMASSSTDPSVILSRMIASRRLPGALKRHIFCHHTVRRK